MHEIYYETAHELAALMTHAALARQPTGREDFSTVITMQFSIVNTMKLLETAIKLHGIYHATADKLVALTTRAALVRQTARRGGVLIQQSNFYETTETCYENTWN